jgi:hypothetical protein
MGSYRRIEAETGVIRETVGRYDPFAGSAPRLRFAAAVYRTAITEKLDAGLSLQRIRQDLVEEYGYGGQLRIGEAVSCGRSRRSVALSAGFIALLGRKARSTSSAARRPSIRPPASGVDRGSFD